MRVTTRGGHYSLALPCGHEKTTNIDWCYLYLSKIGIKHG